MNLTVDTLATVNVALDAAHRLSRDREHYVLLLETVEEEVKSRLAIQRHLLMMEQMNDVR